MGSVSNSSVKKGGLGLLDFGERSVVIEKPINFCASKLNEASKEAYPPDEKPVRISLSNLVILLFKAINELSQLSPKFFIPLR